MLAGKRILCAVNVELTYDGRIPEELKMNLELELRKITESYCILHNIPIRRQFTHEELEESMERVQSALTERAALAVPHPTGESK